jgi:4-hydroxyphenylpyruvate dioxygenase
VAQAVAKRDVVVRCADTAGQGAVKARTIARCERTPTPHHGHAPGAQHARQARRTASALKCPGGCTSGLSRCIATVRSPRSLFMADLFDNPMGLMGFEFVEFASPTLNVLEPLFEKMGFSLVAKHRSKDVLLYAQGDINFIVNREPKSLAGYFTAEHGPSACALAFRVKDSHKAYARAIELGAQPLEVPTGPMELRLPAVKGIGGAALYLIDRFEDGKSIYDIDFEFLPGVERHPRGHGLRLIDHLTHNVYRGRMSFWSAFYERIFNFREIRYFDIKGEYTGLTSRAMTAPDGQIRIPLNEESGKGGTGQIEEFLMKFNGEGIQHIALLTDDLLATVDSLQMAGVPLMAAPNDVYYEMLQERLPGHGEPVAELQARGILMDGSTANGEKRLLLQIFSETLLGPVFFEFIQRKADDGFGEGNFKALFESIERDQVRRGVLKVD